MKIILTAFGEKMWSRPIDIPENSTPVWDMVLMSPIQVFTGYSGQKISEKPAFGSKCRFEWTGKLTFDGERIYVLTDIEKV